MTKSTGKTVMISVKTDDLVAALKSLKVTQKRWRKLDTLIRHGAGVGELILDLSTVDVEGPTSLRQHLGNSLFLRNRPLS